MLEALAKIKPGASRRVHLLLAATAWTVVGAGLTVAGASWSADNESALRPAVVALALVVGALKGWFAIRPAANRVARRIETRGEGRCIGGFFSWRTWLIVLAMSGAGRLLRLTGLPAPLLGFIYLAVGAALLIGSFWLWRAWGRTPAQGSQGA
jgi:hypothetical protein